MIGHTIDISTIFSGEEWSRIVMKVKTKKTSFSQMDYVGTKEVGLPLKESLAIIIFVLNHIKASLNFMESPRS